MFCATFNFQTRSRVSESRHSNTSNIILYRAYEREKKERKTNSNTSNVILYRGHAAPAVSSIPYSNTSNVILYPGSSPLWQSLPPIQIHLMLFFI